jgi:hypothetical protein
VKNPREKLFAVIVACVAVVLVGYFAYSWIAGQYSRRNAEIAKLQKEIKDFERTANKGRAAARKIAQYEERSLPANPEIAATQYQIWLVAEMELAGLDTPKMNPETTIGGERDPFIKQVYQVDATGTLPQVVELLHAFYRMDWLHRITSLTLTPIKDSKWLDIKMKVETLSLRKASSPEELVPRPSNRLALGNAEAYYDAIVGRNLFGPRNHEPKISLSGSLDVFLGREAELTFKPSDPDPLDQVSFQLLESGAPDAKLDPLTGKFTWTPKEEGKYEFVVEGKDDGFPTKASNREKFVINVRPQNAPPPPAIFDIASATILTALLDVDGQGEVWLHVRVPTGQIVTLHQGDQFEIGSMKGTVSEIGEYDFCFDFEGKRRKLGKGEFLNQAKVIGDVPQVASPARPAAEAEVQANPNSGT